MWERNNDWYIKTLRTDFPGFADKVVDVLEVKDNYVYFELEDSSIVKYDDILNTVSVYKDKYDMMHRNTYSEEEWMDSIKMKIYRCMESEGITVKEMSERTGLSVGSISKYINGISVPSATALYKISIALDRDMNYFFDEL